MPQIPVDVHPKFLPLLQVKHSFANIYGGRGGMKSEQTHKVALLDAIQRPIRTCCARETMASIRDSSHKLLADCIYEHGMAISQNGPYEVQESRILRKERDIAVSEFIFVGIRENVRDSKSLKGINRTIIEEAAKVSQDSLDVFVPTVMRTEGAQMWFIWNPEYTSDPVYKMFMLNPPSNTIHIHTNYLENPWLPETMRVLAEDCRRTDPAKYAHIWMGEPGSNVEGAIFAAELQQATDEGRICQVPYDRSKPVDTAWDLGYGDKTAIWFVQAYGGFYNFIDYHEGEGKTIADYLIALQNKNYLYGLDFVPHDAVDAIVHQKLAATKEKSIEMLMRAAGRKVRVIPKLHKIHGINAARTFFSQCRFDERKCADGIQALRHYQWGPLNEHGVTKRDPLHNWASHAADAFRGAALAIKEPKPKNQDKPLYEPTRKVYAPFA